MQNEVGFCFGTVPISPPDALDAPRPRPQRIRIRVPHCDVMMCVRRLTLRLRGGGGKKPMPKPRGRPPQGKRWDGARGRWVAQGEQGERRMAMRSWQGEDAEEEGELLPVLCAALLAIPGWQMALGSPLEAAIRDGQLPFGLPNH